MLHQRLLETRLYLHLCSLGGDSLQASLTSLHIHTEVVLQDGKIKKYSGCGRLSLVLLSLKTYHYLDFTGVCCLSLNQGFNNDTGVRIFKALQFELVSLSNTTSYGSAFLGIWKWPIFVLLVCWRGSQRARNYSVTQKKMEWKLYFIQGTTMEGVWWLN